MGFFPSSFFIDSSFSSPFLVISITATVSPRSTWMDEWMENKKVRSTSSEGIYFPLLSKTLRADVVEFIDFFLNFEEEEVLQNFLLLLLSLDPEKLQVMIL